MTGDHGRNGLNWPESFQDRGDNVKLLTNDDGRKPIAIGHLRESGSLKT